MEENRWQMQQQRQQLLNHLLEGFQQAKQLESSLQSQSQSQSQSTRDRELLAQRIVSSFHNSLSLLQYPIGAATTATNPTLPPDSPISVNASPTTQSHDIKEEVLSNKKRKTVSQKTEHVRVSSQNGLEGPHEDGYSWRKYGQKDILGARYPRSYYRCTYRNTQSCWATKQVQRSDEDPTIFDVTYKGQHTCFQAPKSPDNQEHTIHKLKASLRVNTTTQDIADDKQQQEQQQKMPLPSSFPFSSSWPWGCGSASFKTEDFTNTTTKDYSPSLSSPATPDSTYFFHCHTNNFSVADQNSRFKESDLADILSAHTSKTNSPIPDMDFSLDPLEFDPSFPFHTPGPGYIS